MKKILSFTFILLLYSSYHAQTASELFEGKNYEALVKLESKSDKLTPEDLFKVGYAFFQLENDLQAISFYDKAISKGFDSAYVYYFKGIALRYNQQYDASIQAFDIALKKDPSNQK